jgi:hypothetical protein
MGTRKSVPERRVVVFRVMRLPECFEMGAALKHVDDMEPFPGLALFKYGENEVVDTLSVSSLRVR